MTQQETIILFAINFKFMFGSLTIEVPISFKYKSYLKTQTSNPVGF